MGRTPAAKTLTGCLTANADDLLDVSEEVLEAAREGAPTRDPPLRRAGPY